MPSPQITIKTTDGASLSAYCAIPAAGRGPAVVILHERFGVNPYIRELADFYAEEGYVAIAPDLFHPFGPGIELGHNDNDYARAVDYCNRLDIDRALDDIQATIAYARTMPQVTTGNAAQKGVGVVGLSLGGKLAYLSAARCDIDCAVCYYGIGIEDVLDRADAIDCPMVMHLGALDACSPPQTIEHIRAAFAGRENVHIYSYEDAGHGFNRWRSSHYVPSAASLAHSRSLAICRKTLGPTYDLGALADYHFYLEFAARDTDKTMETMVGQPYVNHVPTMTGGTGFNELRRFYKHHFISRNPQDMKMVPISRTVGVDRMVDEFVLCFTHDCIIDWLLPGVEPTQRYVEIPFVAIVAFRGDKLYNEHIYWDQASLLIQIGKLDPTGLPIAGAETAHKLMDKTRPSNTLMPNWPASANRD